MGDSVFFDRQISYLLQQQAGEVCSLRQQLEQERSLSQEQQEQQQQELAQLKASATHLSAQVNRLRRQRDNHANTVRRHEERISELGLELQQCQCVCQECSRELEAKEKQLDALRAEAATLHQRLECKLDKTEALKSEQEALEEKLEAANSELQRLGEALEEAQAENTHLSQEGQLVLTNVSQWIKEQKRANQKLSDRVKEQSLRLTVLTAERDDLQTSGAVLEEEVKGLRGVCEEQERELQRLKAISSHSDNQQALLHQLQGQLEVEEAEKENLVAHNLNALSDMQNKLKSNMDSILHLNQQLCSLSTERAEQHTQLVRERARSKQLELQLLKGTSADHQQQQHHHHLLLHQQPPPPPSPPHLQRCLSHGSLHQPPSPYLSSSHPSSSSSAERAGLASILHRPAGREQGGQRDPAGARLRRSRSAQRLEDPWVLLTAARPTRPVESRPARTNSGVTLLHV